MRPKTIVPVRYGKRSTIKNDNEHTEEDHQTHLGARELTTEQSPVTVICFFSPILTDFRNALVLKPSFRSLIFSVGFIFLSHFQASVT